MQKKLLKEKRIERKKSILFKIKPRKRKLGKEEHEIEKKSFNKTLCLYLYK